MSPSRRRADALERPALARCVGATVKEFFEDHWGRRPLLSRSSGAGYEDLLNTADADELVSRRGLRTPFIRMAKRGQLIDPSRYTGAGGAGAEIPDQALDERVLGLFADGATLVLQGLHRIWPPLIEFAGQLTTDLGHPVAVNAYLTPPDNQGFAAHYDTHDVFALQVSGTKRWRVHPPVVIDPLPSQPWSGHTEEITATAEGAPVLDVLLSPGDALYLPRGWLHSAQAQHDLSMHLTVGIMAVTRNTLVTELLAMAAEEPELRRSLPPAMQIGDPQQLAGELTETVRTLTRWLEKTDPEAVAARLRQKLWPQGRPAPIQPLAQSASLLSLNPGTRVAIRRHARWRLVEEDVSTGQVTLECFDRTIRFPAYCGEALRRLAAGEPSAARDLPALDAADQLTLVRRLLREAVVVPVDE